MKIVAIVMFTDSLSSSFLVFDSELNDFIKSTYGHQWIVICSCMCKDFKMYLRVNIWREFEIKKKDIMNCFFSDQEEDENNARKM